MSNPSTFTQRTMRYHPPVPDPMLTVRLGRLIARERPAIVHGHS